MDTITHTRTHTSRKPPKSKMQALTSFNVISFFEGFTAASYIRDERVCASDMDKDEEKKKPRVCRRSWGETLASFTAIFTTL